MFKISDEKVKPVTDKGLFLALNPADPLILYYCLPKNLLKYTWNIITFKQDGYDWNFKYMHMLITSI